LFGYRSKAAFFKTKSLKNLSKDAFESGCQWSFCQHVPEWVIFGMILTRNSFIFGFLKNNGIHDHSASVIQVPYDLVVAYIARSIGIIVCMPPSSQKNPIVMQMCGTALVRLYANVGSFVQNIRQDVHEHIYPFTINQVDNDDYYGFSVDGNHKFVLGDFTVTHNSCTAISIAEQFAGVFPNKCLVLAPTNLKENFKQQIFSRKKGTQQCTGNTYNKIAIEDRMLTPEAIDHKISKVIDDKYEFRGFIEFAKHIESLEKGTKGKARYIAKIKKEFSNRVVIIDEVHNVRSVADEGKKKIAPPRLLEVIEHAENVKLVLLTATPMFNEASEIVWLANLLLANDNRRALVQSDIFVKGSGTISKLTPAGPSLLADALRGYVSYMRGENPFSFPMRLVPNMASTSASAKTSGSNKSPKSTKTRSLNPMFDIKGRPIPKEHVLHKLNLATSFMSDYQKSVYEKLETMDPETRKKMKRSVTRRKNNKKKKQASSSSSSSSRDNDTNSSDSSDNDTSSDSDSSDSDSDNDSVDSSNDDDDDDVTHTNPTLLQASNIVYPGTNNVGKHGFLECFDRDKKQFRYKSKLEFLAPAHLATYSPKMKSIVDSILGSTGVVYVYSFYYEGGLVPLAIALEHAGFAKYNSANLLSTSKPSKKHMINGKQATYAMIAKAPYTADFDAEVEAVRADANIRGEEIKVILGSSVSAEGIDFKFIREVHVLEPWYHLNKIEQIVGRAVRNCSHTMLPAEERNVTVFHHTCRIKDRKNETIDERVYRLAEMKQTTIDQVEDVLKENSVDCMLNQNSLYFDPSNLDMKIDIVTSQGKRIKNVAIGDKDGDKYNARQKCTGTNANANANASIGIVDESTFHKSFYSDDIENTIPIVSALFLAHDDKNANAKKSLKNENKPVQSMTYEQIRSNVPKHINDDVLMFTLDYMLTHKSPIGVGTDHLNHLLYRSNLYMLQPSHIVDTRIPIKERGPEYKILKQRNIKLAASGYINPNVPKKGAIDPIATLLEDITNLKESLLIKSTKYDQVLFDYVIDRLDSTELKEVAIKMMGTKNETTRMIESSLATAHLLHVPSPGQGWLLDPLMNSWFNINTGTEVSIRELDNSSIPEIKVPPLKNLTGYLTVFQHKGERLIQFKIIDSTKPLSQGFTCDTTSTFKTDDAKAAIHGLDKTCNIPDKASKRQRCALYELTLRLVSRKKKTDQIIFARPMEVNVALQTNKANMKKNKAKK
jgi:hypothetical protein